MKLLNKFLLIILLASMSCNDNGGSMEDVVLFTYSSEETLTQQGFRLLLLTDRDGQLIDSARSADSNPIQLMGSAKNETFTFTEIVIGKSEIQPQPFNVQISTYSGITVSSMTRVVTADEEIIGTVQVNFDSEIDESKLEVFKPIANSSERNLESHEIIENDRIYFTLRDTPSGSDPKYLLLSDLNPGDVIDVGLDNFDQMEYQAINNMHSFSSLIGMDESGQRGIFIDFGDINNEQVIQTGRVLLPGEAFHEYIIGVDPPPLSPYNFSNTFFGSVPVVIVPLDITGVDIPTSLNDYRLTVGGDYNLVLTFWLGSSSPTNLTWAIFGPKDHTYNLNLIIEILESMYSHLIIGDLELSRLSISNNINLSYDEAVTVFIDNDAFSNTEIIERRTAEVTLD